MEINLAGTSNIIKSSRQRLIWIEQKVASFNIFNNLTNNIMKTRSGIKLIGVSLILYLAFSTGCYYDQVVPVVPELPEEDVSYAGEMQPYFDAKCVSCHNGTGIPLNLVASVSYSNLLTGGSPPYVDVANPTSSKLYTKIAAGGSMEQYSSPTETAMTLKWIEEGAQNN
jgi:hypothetical protein